MIKIKQINNHEVIFDCVQSEWDVLLEGVEDVLKTELDAIVSLDMSIALFPFTSYRVGEALVVLGMDDWQGPYISCSNPEVLSLVKDKIEIRLGMK